MRNFNYTAIAGIATTNTRIRQLVEEKIIPRNCNEQKIAGYRDVLNRGKETAGLTSVTRII